MSDDQPGRAGGGRTEERAGQGPRGPRTPEATAAEVPQSSQVPQGTQGTQDPQEPVDGAATTMPGIELAREALAQAKADAIKRGSVPGSQRRGRPRPTRERGRGGDPRAFGAAIRDLLADRGWEQRAAVGGVFGNWGHIVGPELAEHTIPERFEDGELVIAADSTAWATQLRLLASNLVRRLNEELGDGTVRRVKVTGPASAPRRRGAWRVR